MRTVCLRGHRSITRIKLRDSSTIAFDGNVDFFGREQQAEKYALYRPSYSDDLVRRILSQVKSKDLSVDVACGSGQLTNLLAPYFVRTVGIDKSFEQLKHIKENNKIEYIPGSAFDLPISSGSVDLLTIAQAFHWIIPHDKFYPEISRTLKIGGVFCIVGYSVPHIQHPEAQQIFRDFYVNALGSLKRPGEPGCYWEIYRPDVDDGYANIAFPWPTQRDNYPVTTMTSVKSFIGYLESMSAVKTLILSGGEDPLPAFERRLVAAIGGVDNAAMFPVTVPYFTVSYKKQK